MRKHWKKVFLGLFVICLLVISFWYGGDAPGLQGFSVNETDVAVQQGKDGQSIKENQRSVDSSDEQQDSIKEKVSNVFEPFFMNIKLKKKASTSSDNMQTSKKAQKNANKAVKKEEKKKSSSKKKTKNKKSSEKNVMEDEDTSTKQDTSDSSSEEEKNTTGSTTESTNTTEGLADNENDNETATETTTEATTEVATEAALKDTVTISISCKTLLKQMDLLEASKKSQVPKDGMVLKSTTVEIKNGDTVFDVLQKATKANKIHLEFNYTPAYKSYYIEGIHNIYEFDAGNLSGWMYCVNGEFTGVGCSFYEVQAGDEIQWVYTCDLGKDVGDSLE